MCHISEPWAQPDLDFTITGQSELSRLQVDNTGGQQAIESQVRSVMAEWPLKERILVGVVSNKPRRLSLDGSSLSHPEVEVFYEKKI